MIGGTLQAINAIRNQRYAATSHGESRLPTMPTLPTMRTIRR